MDFFECQGTVTDVNQRFLSFTLDDNFKIHISILLTQKESQKMPRVRSIVKIKNAHRISANTFFVCKSSILEGDFTVDYYKNVWFNLVKDGKLGCTDLLKIETVINEVNQNFSTIEEKAREELVKLLLNHCITLFNYTENCEQDVCLNKHFETLDIITVKSCRYVITQANDKFIDFPYWSFGIHSKPKEGTLLFGHIQIKSSFGFLMLSDSDYLMPCIINNATPEQIHMLEDSYILIKHYRVITEIFQESNVANLEYLFMNFSDIVIIKTNLQKHINDLYGQVKPNERVFKQELCFQLIRKSTVHIGDSKKAECWLQISIKNSTEIFLILPVKYIKVSSCLEEEGHYKLLHNVPLKRKANPELWRIKPIVAYMLLDEQAFFQKLEQSESQKFLTVRECKEYVANSTKLVNFCGILKNKRFANALPSRTQKKIDLFGYGTLGSKVHQLVFSSNENGNTIYLDCYLNNWENTVLPLGLIPQMEIRLRNVCPQSKKYLKSTAFTTFEIIGYHAYIHFDTVNLYENYDLNWGVKTYLGIGKKIPSGVLVWGKVQNIQILSVKMDMNENEHCTSCRQTKENTQICTHQNGKNTMNFLIKMHVSDEYGQSKILAKSPKIMKTILDLQDRPYEIWLNAFSKLRQYEYNFFEEVVTTDFELNRSFFRDTLTQYIKLWNSQNGTGLDLKCRKLDSDPKRNGGRPLWFCIDARKSLNF